MGFGAVKLLQSDLYRRARRVLSQWISSTAERQALVALPG